MARRFAALAVAGLAALAYLVEATPTPRISPAEAAAWEGQVVAVRGVVRGLRLSDDVARFDLVLNGHALAVRAEGRAPPEGAPVEAKGRLGRFGGALTLLADDVRAAPLDPGLPVGLAALAQDPATWRDTPVNVTGVLEKDRLKADGHSIALGRGDWPKEGAVTTTVLLRYDAACACHRLDRVAPWTP